ncbi:hypothetical protein J3R75_001999 [Oligosphaera ethanolica]|uniref:Uncharacterized protein n=1 Tax=Oligosphaera ethanolica TaxID=760260 RepID=A0AAE3VG75_9BACT|nr:hypothetical protein [Oligosphaera ethanolica]
MQFCFIAGNLTCCQRPPTSTCTQICNPRNCLKHLFFVGEGKGRRPFPSPTPPLYPISGGVSWGAAVASPPRHAAGWGEFFASREGAKKRTEGCFLWGRGRAAGPSPPPRPLSIPSQAACLGAPLSRRRQATSPGGENFLPHAKARRRGRKDVFCGGGEGPQALPLPHAPSLSHLRRRVLGRRCRVAAKPRRRVGRIFCLTRRREGAKNARSGLRPVFG